MYQPSDTEFPGSRTHIQGAHTVNRDGFFGIRIGIRHARYRSKMKDRVRSGTSPSDKACIAQVSAQELETFLGAQVAPVELGISVGDGANPGSLRQERLGKMAAHEAARARNRDSSVFPIHEFAGLSE
jgi:hypothetical protein